MTTATRIEIIRAPDSFTFNRATLKPVYLDAIRLMYGDTMLFECRCQSVAIHPSCSQHESIAPGDFQVRVFAERRTYEHPVHEIINAFDIEGERIDNRAMQIDAERGVQGRWLIHDDYNPATRGPYKAPWSAGCIMVPCSVYGEFNALLTGLGHKSGDIIPASLRERA
jgi:hypothetical protein